MTKIVMHDAGAQELTAQPLPIADYYRIIRGQIEHEDNLMGTRLNWFITSMSFFFTAYAIDVTSIQAAAPVVGNEMNDTRVILRLMIPGVAIVCSVLIQLTIIAGVLATHHLRRLYRVHVSTAAEQKLPPLQGYTSTWAMGLAAPLLLPMVFLGVWLFLLMHGGR